MRSSLQHFSSLMATAEDSLGLALAEKQSTIDARGNVIRQLKSSGASKSDIDEAVKVNDSNNETESRNRSETVKGSNFKRKKSENTQVPNKRLKGRMHRSGKEFLPSCKRNPTVSSDHDAKATNSVTESSNNTMKEEQHGLITEVPRIIYSFVQDALKLRRRLERYKDDEKSKSALEFAEDKIAGFTKFYIDINILPPGWKYDPATASNLVIKSFRGSESKNWKRPGKKLGFEKHKIEQPQINDVPLDDTGLKSLKEFIDIDKETPAMPPGCIPREKDERVVKVDVAIAVAVCDYAVNAFNKALETYDKKEKRKLSEVVLKKCSYHKMCNNEYWFTLTLEAVEEGILGVYKSIVSCTMVGGKMKLFNFIRARPPKGKREVPRPISKHKTLKGNFDPSDYYNYTGFVERRYDFGGYDYRNPNEVLFRLLN